MDLVFVGVEYLAVPSLLRGVAIDNGTAEDQSVFSAAVGDIALERIYVLVSEGHRYPVVAAACRVTENDRDIFGSPF